MRVHVRMQLTEAARRGGLALEGGPAMARMREWSAMRFSLLSVVSLGSLASGSLASVVRRSSVLLWACAAAAACGGDDKDDDKPVACTTDVDCITPDKPCAIGTCAESGTCTYESAPDGAAVTDVEGDCRHATCVGGIPKFTTDNSDFTDDDDPCTQDSCVDGQPRHAPQENGSLCRIGSGSGTCQQGACLILCTDGNAATQCDDDDQCTTDVCIDCDLMECRGLGRCSHGLADGAGPDDFNDCTTDLCQNGEPVHEPAPATTPCSVGGNVCNAIGECVDCIADVDCEGQSVQTCFVPICADGICDSGPAPKGSMPPDTDVVGDCHAPVCSGTGSLTNVIDDSDVPDDGSVCTLESCLDGVPQYTYADAGTSCGDSGQICNEQGECCSEYVYPGAAGDMLAIRYAYVSQYSYTPYLTKFAPATGVTTDIAALDLDPTQIAFAPATKKIYFMDSAGVGVLASCGGTQLEALTLPEPDTATALSVPAALAFDTTDDQVLLASSGGAGVLYGYAPASGAWSEIASMDNVDVVAGTYDGTAELLYMADATWSTTLFPYTTAGVAQTAITLTSTLSTTGISSVQLRAAGDYVYYILQGYDFGSYFQFIELDPATGIPNQIYP